MNNFFRFLLHPCGAIAAPVLASMLAWLLPSLTGVTKGYIEGIPFYGGAWVVLFIWYLVAGGCGMVGYFLGNHIVRAAPPDYIGERGVFSDRYLWFLTFFGCVGVGAASFVIYRALGLSGIITAINDSQANQLKQALYDEYSVGVLSLRYVSILAAGVSLGDFLINRKIKIVHLIAGVILLVNAAVSSRLSLIWTLAIGLGLYYSYQGAKRSLRITTWVLGGGFAFALLTVFNYIRNSGTYEKYGVQNPVAANVAEIQRYLSAPFQGALSASQNSSEVASGVDPWLLSGIDPSLTTNSAIFAMLPQFGYFAFAVVGLLTCVAGILMGFSRHRSGSIISIAYFVAWYCFAELWRGNLFTAGITLTLLTFTAGVAFFGGRFFSIAPVFVQPKPPVRKLKPSIL